MQKQWGMYRAGALSFINLIQGNVSAGDVEFLAKEMSNAVRDERWEDLQALVILGMKRPSPAYNEALCEALQFLNRAMTNEDIVDLLWETADDSCIPALVAAATTPLEWDEYGGLAKKALAVLEHMETDMANDAVRSINS